MTTPQLPLGIRTSNYTNVGPCALPDVWEGQVGIRADECSDFGPNTPESVLKGLRAGVKNLHSYAARDGIETIRAMSAQWAPANATNVLDGRKNNPLEHAQAVAEESGFSVDAVLDFTNQAINRLVIRGIIFAENGHQAPGVPWATDDQLLQAQAESGLWDC